MILLVGASVAASACGGRRDDRPAATGQSDASEHGADAHSAGHPAAEAQAAPATGAMALIPPGPPANPVQAEMRLLNEATRDWVTAIAQNSLAAIPAGISRVHAARQVTDDALQRGEYSPPKGGAAARAAFIEQDEAFHGELVTLLRAAQANDLEAATRQLGVVLQGCTSCHTKFRFEAGTPAASQ